MAKTAAFGVVHLATSFVVGYALTGNVAIAGALTFVEPAVNTVIHYFFDRYWDRQEARRTGHGSGHGHASASASVTRGAMPSAQRAEVA